ncbi:GGDEF domain-containing protein [Actinoplanes sp. NPDC049596]|uniref:GGDEF domain-containing protein n=1 Tax=unclassified Actinoplanes TaxID=2626549 RepID=UPI003448EBFC
MRIPGDNLKRTRLAALVVGSAGLLSQATQIGNSGHSAGYLGLTAAAILALLGLLNLTYVRDRSSWWTVPVVPVLIAVGGSGLQDPIGGLALALASSVVFSLYGSRTLWGTRLALAAIAYPASVAISPQSLGRELSWHSGNVLALIPQLLLMATLTRGIYRALRRQERTAAREALLARAGSSMLGVTDIDRIREIGRSTAEELVALNPGVALLIVRRDPGGLRVANLAGVRPSLRGRRLANLDELKTLLPELHSWTVNTIDAELDVVVAGRRTVPAEVQDAFRTLSHQVVLAEGGCLAHAELEHSAHHDHLTQLPNRAKFLRAVAAAPGPVALLNVDLDDFKQVNDTHGHAAGDELLQEIAHRLTTIAHGRGVAGRFGGDEFALLLTDPAAAPAIAAQLGALLATPVTLTAATVTVGASIGIALSEPGITVKELTRRADMAMYAAKTMGKNRIETYSPQTHPVAA